MGFQTCKCLCKVIKVKMHMYLELTVIIRSITINLLYSLVEKTSLSRSLLESVKKSVNSLSISAWCHSSGEEKIIKTNPL